MRRMVLMLMSAIVATAACSDSTAPRGTRVTRQIYNIHVPAAAAAGDSIRLSFNYERAPCDSAVVVEARPGGAETRFTVSSFQPAGNCPNVPSIATIPIPVVYVVAPPHAVPYTLKFAEPGAPDSVRVVQPQ